MTPETLADLAALTLDPDRPLVAVDADEVLVAFAAPLADWLAPRGIALRLTSWRLEDAMWRGDTALGLDAALAEIDGFFADAVARQPAIPGAAAALARLARVAQIVVLTNVPRHGRAARVANLAGHGIPYPLVANEGGKGAALAWMADRVAAPVAFIDDSPGQIASVARQVPRAVTVHFCGVPELRAVLPPAPEARHRALDWAEAEAVIRAGLADSGRAGG